jgi:hypothetical protein
MKKDSTVFETEPRADNFPSVFETEPGTDNFPDGKFAICFVFVIGCYGESRVGPHVYLLMNFNFLGCLERGFVFAFLIGAARRAKNHPPEIY